MEQCEICCGRKEIVLPRIKEPAIFKNGDPLITEEIMAKRYPCPECQPEARGLVILSQRVTIFKTSHLKMSDMEDMAKKSITKLLFMNIQELGLIKFHVKRGGYEGDKLTGSLAVGSNSTQEASAQLNEIHVRQQAFELLDKAMDRFKREVTNWNSHYENGMISKEKTFLILEEIICRIKAEEVS